MSSEIEWRWADPRGQQRLVRTDELRAALANGIIPSNAPVWRAGWTEWQSASDVPELMSSALAAKNGVVPNIPPPPLFIVAVQSAYEGNVVQAPTFGGEPPPPPRYVPETVPTAPAPPPTPTVPVSTAAAQTAAAAARATAANQAARSSMSKKTVVGIAPPPAGTPGALSASEQLKRMQHGNAPPEPARPPSTRPRPPEGLATVVGVPAIVDPRRTPMMPQPADSRPSGRLPAPAPTPSPRPPSPKSIPPGPGSMKRQTLILYGGAPTGEAPPPSATSAATAPPIVVPAPHGTSSQPARNAVTQAPPWGEGAVGIGPEIPKSAPTPRVPAPDSVEELSGSMLLETDGAGDTVGITRMNGPASVPPARTSAPPARNSQPKSIPPPVPRKVTQRPPNFVPSASLRPAQTVTGLGPNAPSTLRAGTAGPADAVDSFAAAPPPINERSAATIPPSMSLPRDGGIDPTPRTTNASFTGEASAPAPFPWLEPFFAKLPVLGRLQVGRPKFFIPVIGGLAAFTTLIVFGVLVRTCTSALLGDDSDRPVASARPTSSAPVLKGTSASTGTAASGAASNTGTSTSTSTSTSRTGIGTGASNANLGPCTVAAASAKSIAPRALVPSGVEVVAAGNTIAAGFVTSAKDGQVVVLDPSTLAPGQSVHVHGAEPLRRVMPLLSEGKAPQGSADADRKSDRMMGRRAAPGWPSIDVGVTEGSLVWAPHGTERIAALWALPGEGAAEALRAVPLDGAKGYAVAFRRAGAVWMGIAIFDGKALSAKGELAGVAGLGPQVGSPAVAASGDFVLVVWADRASPDEPWGLRWQRLHVGAPGASDVAEPARAFTPPAGGLGAPFMSPGVTSLGGGRFLVVWTEGAVSSHQVRAQTIDANGAPLGGALLVSAEGANAGQGQAAVGSDGRGLVAYLASNGKSFEVVATPITCPR